MACERYRDALTDVATGMPATTAVEAHLASCEACRAELQALRRALAEADTEMAGLLAAEPSPELAVRIRQAVDASETDGPALREGPWLALRFGWLWPATAAAATLLVALAVVIGRGQPPAPGPRVAEATPRPQPPATTRTSEPADRPLDPQASAERRATVVNPKSVGQAERRGVRSPGGSLGTRQARVARDDRAFQAEVLVPPGEGEALLRFVAQLQRRAVAPDSLLVADLSAPLTEPGAVEFAPLEIIPLDPDETSGSD